MLRASNKRDLNKNDGVVVVIVVIVVIVSSCQYKVQVWCFKFFILSVVALCYKCIVCICLIICMQDMSA